MVESFELQVVHVVEDMSSVSGGVAAVVAMLTEEMSRDGVRNVVVCVRSNSAELHGSVTLMTLAPTNYWMGWGYSEELATTLERLSTQKNTIFHIHGVWKAPQFIAAKYAVKNGAPFLVTTHAMLESWFWKDQGYLKKIKKKIYWYFFSKNLLQAKVVHAITSKEKTSLEKIFKSSDIPIIPNVISLESHLVVPTRVDCDQKYFLFIGRLHPQKGLDILLKGFLNSGLSATIQLKIVGPDGEPSYSEALRRFVNENDLGGMVSFLGPKFGEEKQSLIANAWVCVVPSRVEVIGIVNLEAGMFYCPTITTFETGLLDWEEGGGLLIRSESVVECRDAMLTASEWSLEERKKRGMASRLLIENRYNIKHTRSQWLGLYRQLNTSD
jgi:glycosyltransferase involved in cell wall biosynthesis